MRVGLTLCVLFLAAPAAAESIHLVVPVPAGQPATAASPEDFFGRLQVLDSPGLGFPAGARGDEVIGLPVLPILVLLPPDVSGKPLVSVEGKACRAVAVPVGQGPRMLLNMETGAEAEAPPVAPADGAQPGKQAQGPGLRVNSGASAKAGEARRQSRTAGGERAWHVAAAVEREGDAALLPLLLFPVMPTGPGTALACDEMELHIEFERGAIERDPEGDFLPLHLARRAVNAADLLQWYDPRRDDAGTHDYIIITRKLMADSSTMLPKFVEWKTEQGHTPLVITLEEITEAAADQSQLPQELIRGWLQENYKQLDARYVLLIGNHLAASGLIPKKPDGDEIPMKVCYPALGYEQDEWFPGGDVPTDMYYADMTGNWNPDGDDKACELEDYVEIPEQPDEEPGSGQRLDGVDLAPELLVGRIPHVGKLPFFMDGVLERLIEYEKSPPAPWHNRALLATPMVTFPDGGFVDGGLVAKFIVEKSLAPAGVGSKTLTEWEGNLPSKNPGDGPLNNFTFADAYNEGFGAVFWCAHGNSEGAYQDQWYFDADGDGLPQQGEVEEPPFVHATFCEEYSGEKPAIVFHGSCLNADPSDPGNIAATLLRYASVADVASTRITMGLAPEGEDEWTPSPFSPGGFTMGAYFTHAVVVSRKPVGEAFAIAGNALSFGVQPWTFKVRLEFNLFGDPSLAIPACAGNEHCDDLNLCNGLETCKNGKCAAGTPLVCPPDDPATPCEDSTCLPESGCAVVSISDFMPCEDWNPCTIGEMCIAGVCSEGKPLECPEPTQQCYSAVCDPATGECAAAPAENGVACYLPDWSSGVCKAGDCMAPEPETPDIVSEDVLDAAQSDVPPGDPTPPPPASSSSGCSSSPTGSSTGSALLLCLGALLLGALRRSRAG